MSFLSNPIVALLLWIVVIIVIAIIILLRIFRSPREYRRQAFIESIPTILGFAILMLIIFFFPGIFTYLRDLITHKR
ncbi:hypothetical protein KDA_08180 [Dictyobacter alpinus]|uniref:Uncharacterized protein n=1 Tax=Dictyobacter alpinus TaxID=2014873 RepID=A0A402B1V1_9CHLR|nr:hypothetical protein [Dictyobacter alpinus]GCE25334.1 hypothetical protein KDA_08180 [Dictyobacter alpinus]